MANTLTAVDGGKPDNGPSIEHNSKERAKIISECGTQMKSIMSQRKDLNEEASEIRERLRDNGIDVKSFMAALRLSEMDDTNARDNYLDGLKESFRALGMGGQLDWVDQVTDLGGDSGDTEETAAAE